MKKMKKNEKWKKMNKATLIIVENALEEIKGALKPNPKSSNLYLQGSKFQKSKYFTNI